MEVKKMNIFIVGYEALALSIIGRPVGGKVEYPNPDESLAYLVKGEEFGSKKTRAISIINQPVIKHQVFTQLGLNL